MNLWCHDRNGDRIFTFGKFRAKLAYGCANFFQIFLLKDGKYVLPEVVRKLVNGEIVEEMKDNEDAFNEAWIFYGKMISHFWGIVLSLTILLGLISIMIGLHVESADAINSIVR